MTMCRYFPLITVVVKNPGCERVGGNRVANGTHVRMLKAVLGHSYDSSSTSTFLCTSDG